MPRPPTTTAPRNVNDSSSVNDSGATKPCPYANSAPPTPAYAPRDREQQRLGPADVHAAGPGRPLAVPDGDQRPAEAAAGQVGRQQQHQRGHRQAEQVEPLVGVDREPARHRRLRHRQAGDAAGDRLGPLDHRPDRDREGERDQRQVEPAQPHRRNPERQPDQERHRGRHRHGQQVRQAGLGQHGRRGVRADGEERALPEGDLPGVTDQQAEPHRGHRVRHDQREVAVHGRVRVERDRDDDDRDEQARCRPAARLCAREPAVTRTRLMSGPARAASTRARSCPAHLRRAEQPGRPDHAARRR